MWLEHLYLKRDDTTNGYRATREKWGGLEKRSKRGRDGMVWDGMGWDGVNEVAWGEAVDMGSVGGVKVGGCTSECIQ